jgi:hypothetical protein
MDYTTCIDFYTELYALKFKQLNCVLNNIKPIYTKREVNLLYDIMIFQNNEMSIWDYPHIKIYYDQEQKIYYYIKLR